MKALISPNDGNRVCGVDLNEFPVALPLYWVVCGADVTTEWSFDGHAFHPPVPPPVEFPSLTAWQVRKVLNLHGLRDTVEAMVLASPIEIQDGWHYASEYLRDDSTLLALATQLGLTSAQLDAMFIEASSL